ncbi:hypothetical protein CEG14_16425 [Bordetella genomosp. 1]|uniref:Uncharacterized protein n=1 Tax=Bordetella genomosp. 1 TaxID=1395607 RepID=A0A261SGN1_9BORD|nr:hypothetical protein [Bordetella genomosp. 1]OZI36564.1 hypothetical protein CEG14_16425 [Bordetella genomosp. 1]
MLENKMMPILLSIGAVALLFTGFGIYVSVAQLPEAQSMELLKAVGLWGLAVPPVLLPTLMLVQRHHARKRTAAADPAR